MKFEKLKPGMVVYDVGSGRLGKENPLVARGGAGKDLDAGAREGEGVGQKLN